MSMRERIKWYERLVGFLIVAAISVVVGIPAITTKAAIATSGVIEDGTNRTEWEYDKGTKTLVISGTGEMLTDSGDNDWKNLSATQKIIVREGITTVAYNAFYNMKKVTSVELPNGITSINGNAFLNCESLVTINIPDTVKNIDNAAFQNCYKLKSVKLPDNLETIGSYAFGWCYELEGIVLPDSLKSIGEYAFANLNYLTTVNIPEGLERLEDYTFSYCYNLVRVSLPDSLTDIGGNAFNEVNNAIFYCSNDYQTEYCELKGYKYFDITEKIEITSTNITVDNGSAVWNGSKVIPAFSYKQDDVVIPLLEGEDYKAVYKDNIAVGTAAATITGLGMFEGEVTKSFTISKADISCSPCYELLTFDVTLDGKKYWSSTSATPMDKISFDGKKHTFGITNVKYNGIPLIEGTDYRLENNAKDIISNGGSIYINGLKNLSGSRYVDIPGIEAISIDDLTIEQLTKSVTFNMQEQRPQFKVTYGEYEFPAEYINCLWINNVNSAWNSNCWFNNVDSGSIELTVNGVQGYKSYDYEIKAADISNASMRFTDETYYSYGMNRPATPIPEVMYTFAENEGSYLLNNGTDYVVTYDNNIETGTATATIKGIGNYIGSKELEFKVVKDALIESYDITLEKDTYTFTGKEIKPAVKEVKVNGEIWDVSNYNVSYDGCVNVGSAWLTISGKGDYKNFLVQKEFTIAPASADDCEFTVKNGVLWTKGEQVYPEYSITLNGVSVPDGYTGVDVKYENNTDYGTGKAIFTLSGNVEGTKTVEFQIKKNLFNNFGWQFEEELPFYEYTGKEITPKGKLFIYENDTQKSVTEGKDYELSYRNNVDIGTGYVVINGIGEYAGSTEMSFSINRSNDVTYDKVNKVLTISGEGEMKISKLPEYSQLAEKIIIKEGITTISNNIFKEFTRLKEVELPDTLVSIGDWAFQSCRNLTHLTIPDSVKEIRPYAFWDCYNLKTINIPASMKEIGERAFSCTGIENVVIPDNIKTIREYAFSDCSRLESMVIPSSVSKIEDYAFRYCWTLKKVSFPAELSNTESIGLKTFEDTSDELIVYCNSDYQVDYCEQYGIRYIDARVGYQLTDANVGFYQNGGSVDYVGEETKIALACNGIKLIEGVDYKAVYKNADKIGKATVTITGIGVYAGTVEKSYTINPANIWFISKDVNDESFKGDFDVYVDDVLWDGSTVAFDGKQHTISINNLWYMNEDNVLTEDVDYVVVKTYGNGYNSLGLCVEGKGNYTGGFEFNLDMEQIDINDCEISMETPASVTYTSKYQSPKFKISYNDYVFPDTAYEVVWSGDDYDRYDFRNAHTGKVLINTGFYDVDNPHATLCGALNKEFDYEITPLNIENAEVLFNNDYYVINPKESGSNIISKDLSLKIGDVVIDNIDDSCSVTFENNDVPGMATAVITGARNCTGTVSANYKVVMDIEGCEVNVAEQTYDYTGEAIEAGVIIKDSRKLLEKDKDYLLSYSDNIDEGMASITVSGVGDYIGTATIHFNISKVSIEDSRITIVPEYDKVLYDGTEKKPNYTVKFNEKLLQQDKDYSVTYVDNTSAGIATATITGAGIYTGVTIKEFEIFKYNISEAVVELDYNEFTYDGKEHIPNITVKHNEIALKVDVDYKLSVQNSVDAGQYKVNIEGVGQYAGMVELEYSINPIALDDADVSLKDTIFTYDGSAKKPSVTVNHGGSTLVADRDYQLSYKNNIDEGTAYAVVDGINNYSGHIEVSFKILPYQSGMDAVYKEGDTLTDDDYIYHIIDDDDKEVEFTAPADNKETDVVVPSTITDENGTVYTVTSIGEKAFYKNTKIKKLTIANTVKSIENYAFYGCKNLTTIKIGNGIEIVGDSSFRQCTKLTSITLPKSVDKLGKNCFYGCKKLKTITLKSNQVVDVQKNAIKGISKKCVIKVPKKLVKKYKKEFDKKTGFKKTMKIKKK